MKICTFLGICFLALQFASCQTPQTPFARVLLDGVAPGAERLTLKVTVAGKTTESSFSGADPFDLLTVDFPPDSRGDALFEVQAFSGPSCLLSSASGLFTITSNTVFEVRLKLVPPPLACGAPAARLTVGVLTRPGEAGVIVSSPAGISCGSDCDEVYPKGAQVTLRAQPGALSPLTWLAPGCSGGGDCTLTLNGDIKVEAVFTACHGFCPEPSGTTQNLNAIYGGGPSNVVAVGDLATIVQWDGQAWGVQPVPCANPLQAVTLPRGGQSFLAVGNNGVVVTQKGPVWVNVTVPDAEGLQLRGVAGARADEIFIVGFQRYLKGNVEDGFRLLKADGTSSTPPDLVNPSTTVYGISLRPDSDQHAVVTNTGLNVLRTRGPSGEDSFGNAAPPSNRVLYGVWHGSDIIFSVGTVGTIVSRSFIGGAWTNFSAHTSPVTGQSGFSLRGVFGVADNDVYAVGDDGGTPASGKIIHYDGNAAKTWTAVGPASLPRVNGVWASSSNSIYFVGAGGYILHYLP